MDIRLLNFDIKGDNRGSLIAIENYKEVPFGIKRIYYIFDTKYGISRGFHAHKKLEQVLICLNGSCVISVDDGLIREDFLLDYPDKGLYIGNNIWREMKHFSQGCVLLVLASDYYNTEDYINDYECFIKECCPRT